MIQNMTQAYEPGTIPTFELHDRADKALTVAGLSRTEMAEYVGVRPETLSRYLTGKSAMPVGTLRLIALRTGVPFEWLQKGESPRPARGPDGGDLCAIRDSNPEPADKAKRAGRRGALRFVPTDLAVA